MKIDLIWPGLLLILVWIWWLLKVTFQKVEFNILKQRYRFTILIFSSPFWFLNAGVSPYLAYFPTPSLPPLHPHITYTLIRGHTFIMVSYRQSFGLVLFYTLKLGYKKVSIAGEEGRIKTFSERLIDFFAYKKKISLWMEKNLS